MTSQLSDESQTERGACPAVETRWLDAEEQKAWRAWLYSAQLLQDRLDRELTHGTGISHAYYEILVALSETPGRMMRMSELADRCLSSRSRLSHAVSRLEERGWVRRDRHPTDRRGAVAVLTDDGYAAVVAAAPGHVAAVREVFFDRVDEAQLAVLREVFEELAEEGGVGPDVGG